MYFQNLVVSPSTKMNNLPHYLIQIFEPSFLIPSTTIAAISQPFLKKMYTMGAFESY